MRVFGEKDGDESPIVRHGQTIKCWPMPTAAMPVRAKAGSAAKGKDKQNILETVTSARHSQLEVLMQSGLFSETF